MTKAMREASLMAAMLRVANGDPALKKAVVSGPLRPGFLEVYRALRARWVLALTSLLDDPRANRASVPTAMPILKRRQAGSARRGGHEGCSRRRRYGRHRQAPARRRGEGIMPLGRHQQERGFAGFSPAPDQSLANADTCRSQKAKAFCGVRRSRATTSQPSVSPPSWRSGCESTP
jgi:hypothetical protein